ncbi:MAG TPA: DUF1501 domain-containing protein [Gemmataceae bacterium]|nr:DUF1501 domain-containing protein [Gemmataceae bacterium]
MTHGRDCRYRASRSIERRQFLQIGGLGALGLNLAGLFRASEALAAPSAAASAARIKACIFIFYYGGPSHLDTYDLKPDAPAEVRGEFKSIATTVPGLRICEHLPRMAKVMHKVAVIRSMHHTNRLHDSASIETHTGRPSPNGDREEFAPIHQFFPSCGSVLSHQWRQRRLDIAHAALPFSFHNVVDVPCQGAGFLGAAYDPFRIAGDPATLTYRPDMLRRPADVPPSRLDSRRALLHAVDLAPQSPGARQLASAYQKAFDLLGSEPVGRALDIEQEPAAIRERYGLGPRGQKYLDDHTTPGGPQDAIGRNLRGQNLLLARRLVEAGVPFVNVYDYKQQGKNWDAHAKNFKLHKDQLLPAADQALSALIEDLDARGLLASTLVVALGEFGRTPRINKDAGRDHWPDCYSVILAGGGVKGGTVYGASDRIGAYPRLDPATPGDLAATIFWRFGLNPASEIHDLTGRPYRLAEGEPIRKLFS